MEVVYSRETFPLAWKKSIFLAGPTPQKAEVKSWRSEALRILKTFGYDGVVFVPEDRGGGIYENFNYREQVEWEHKALNAADCILFWVPRNLEMLPGFTTNVEFGLYVHLGKSVLGYPPEAEKIKYLDLVAEKNDIPILHTLQETIEKCLDLLNPGAMRVGGERDVPLRIWRTGTFQLWYRAQKRVGNRIDGAVLKWIHRVGKNREHIFSFAMHLNIHIASENRNKTNEILISRPDIATVILYTRALDILQSRVILVREFRTPASTPDCYIWELPGGSPAKPNSDPYSVAAEEVYEETGFKCEPKRFQAHGARQLAGTFTAHKAHLFSVELTEKEMQWFISQRGVVHGADLDNPTGERTYIEVKTVKEILSERLLDWSNIGKILSVLTEKGDE
ncbi:MAG: NUDIX hydrolase [Candidatus Harrisonbacteria bacterium]|nr:NUDIX hydrolase [Candidatus Harrisonbacteria bacterium]